MLSATSAGRGASSAAAAALSQEEIEACRRAFAIFDRNSSGSIDLRELKAALLALGHKVSDHEVQLLMAQIDEDKSREIEFHEFLKVIVAQKQAKPTSTSDTLHAFVAMGGNEDMTGSISIAKLKATLDYFELKVDLDGLVKSLDKDESGTIDYKEFSRLLEE